MKRGFVIFLFFVIMFSILISASNIGLIENQTWQQNLTASLTANGAVLGDIDGDGDLDMISIGCDSTSSICPVNSKDKSYVWINNGTSFIEDSTWEQNLSKVGGGSLGLGDIDNDGDLDLLLAGNIPAKVYINNGTTFTENLIWQNEFTVDDAGSASLALGDIDNDGDLDVVFPDMGSTKKSVWINNGTSFVGSSIWSDELAGGSKISTGLIDIDNDGDLDLSVVGDSSAKGYLNNGTSFVAKPDWNLVPADEGSVAWGDFENDGDFDEITSGFFIVFGTYDGSEFSNNVSWNFDVPSRSWGSIMLGDYTNNGFLDLMTAGMGGGDAIYIAENNGTIFARDVTAEANLTGIRKGSALWGDIDNDGDLDLVVIKSQKVYISNASLTNPNEDPTPPTTFSSSYNNREIALGWLNGSDNETSVNGLYYNLKLGTLSNNHSIISGIYGGQGDASRGGTAFGYFGNMMQRKNFTLKVDRLQPSTTYYWSVQTIDTGLKAGNWSTAQSFTTGADLERPNVTLNSPVDNFNSSSYSITFNASVADENITNVSLWGNWTGSFVINETNSTGVDDADYIFTVDLTSHGDGTYTWRIEATDNETNVQNSSIRTFTIDTTPPNVAIVSPVNDANSSDTGLDISYTVSDSGVGLDSCWYSNDTMSINTSITCGTNITTLTWLEGEHNITVYANDSAGNENSSTINFTIDITNPVVNMLTLNYTNTTDTGLNITYSATDTFLDSCWYSNDTMSVNTTLSNCANITSITWLEGNHNITVYANDSSGNEGENYSVFTIDTTGPTVTIVSPSNGTNSSDAGLDVNYTVSDLLVEVDSCWYSNNTYLVNTSITCGTNLTDVNWSDFTSHNVTIWANDTLGNEGKDIIFFTINTTDVTAPVVTLIDPSDSKSYTSNSQEINFTFNISEINEISSCSLIIDGTIDSTNSSVNKLITQNFTKTFTPATHTWNVNCTDTNNNVGNSSVRTFTVTAPAVAPSGGGGGGGGATTPTPTPVLKTFDVDFSNESSGSIEANQGDVKTFTFNGQTTHKITLSEITSTSVKIIIESEPIILVLLIGEIKQVDINQDGINDLEIKIISILNLKVNFLLTKLEGADIVGREELEEEARKEALFDVKVSILDKFKKVLPGEEVVAEIEVFNVNNIGQVDVIVDYYVSDNNETENKTKLVQASDTMAIEAVSSFVRSLIIPENTRPGRYFFVVDVSYKDFITSSNAEFKVKSEVTRFLEKWDREIIIGVLILIAIIVLVYLKRIRKVEKKEKSLERMIGKLKKKGKI